MASEIYVKLSEMDRPAKPVNDSDLVFIAQSESGVVESKAMAVSDLRALLNFENAYTTTALGLAATTANQIFYVYTDSNKVAVNPYVNRSGIAEAVLDSSGTKKVFYTQKGISKVEETTEEIKSFIAVNILEFTSKITDKPDPSDPGTWDWSPAFQAAFEKIATFVVWKSNNNLRYSSATLVISPGYYRCSSKVRADFSSFTGYVTGRPKLSIRAEGAIIGCGVSKGYVWELIGAMMDIQGLSFTKDNSVSYAYGLKLGDETQSSSSYACTGMITNCRFTGLTKNLVCGWAFDMVISNMYATGFVQDPNSVEPATAFEILQHNVDNCNHITFIRPQFETSNTTNYQAIRINGNSHSSTHHNLHFYGGHIETHCYGVQAIALINNGNWSLLQSSFNGVVFLENGTNTEVPAASTYLMDLSNCCELSFNSCRIATGNRQIVSFDPDAHKAMIHYTGTAAGLAFRDTYFVTPFTNVTGSTRNIYSVIDAREHNGNIFSFSMENCSINDFKSAIGTTGRIRSGRVTGSRKFLESVSDDGLSFSMYWTNADFLDGNFDTVFKVSSAGVLTSNAISTGAIDGSSLRVGYNLTSSGTRQILFYPLGSTIQSASLECLNTGRFQIVGTSDITFNANGGSNLVRTLGHFTPVTTNLYDIGTPSLLFRNGYFSGAVALGTSATISGNPVGVKVPVPTGAAATGLVGQWAADANYYYVCIAVNTWVRAPLATW